MYFKLCTKIRTFSSLRFQNKTLKPSFNFKSEDSTEKISKKLQDYDNPIFPKNINPKLPDIDWLPKKGDPRPGFLVPSTFRIGLNTKLKDVDGTIKFSRDTSKDYTYTDFCGLRYPTLETTRNRNYWKDQGFNKITPRIFPIKLPIHRKVDPLMREYIYFLHTLDPGRFRIERIGERYGFKPSTISKIVKEFSLLYYIKKNKLCKIEDKRVDLEEHRLQIKELSYRDKLCYIHTSNERDDSELEYKGDKDTIDWLHRQSVVVDAMTAFPYASTRSALPKRVDVDLTVKNDRNVKVINWIDPTDKVVI